MKKNILFSILLLLLVVFNIFIGFKLWSAIEDNDDFAPYTEKNFDVAYIISSDILSPSQLKNEVTPIAQNYEKNVKLTSLDYHLENKNSGLVILEFYKSFPEKNKACTIEMKLDIATKKIYNIIYRKGHGKRIGGHENEIINTIDTDILSYLTDENIEVTILNYGVYSRSFSVDELERMK